MANKKTLKLTLKYLSCLAGLILLAGFIFIAIRNPVGESGASAFVKLRTKLAGNSAAVYLLHTYHSIRKLPDVLFFPYFFQKSRLPLYRLYVSPGDIVALNDSLAEDPISGYLHDENRLWVKGTFIAGDYQAEVKVRYRGTNANHWNSLQKSWRVKFPKDNLFNGQATLDLVIPYDRDYYVEPLNYYRGKKLGLNALDASFSRLVLNGQDAGVYLTYEPFSDNWLESRRISTSSGIFNGDDSRRPGDTAVAADSLALETSRGPALVNKLTAGATDDSLKALNSLVENADDETFKKLVGQLVDLDKFYAWDIVNILAGSTHRPDSFADGNVITIFNPVTGKFEFAPWDVEIEPVAEVYKDNSFKLARRILSVPEFLKERNARLAAYLKDGQELADDLSFYDNLFSKTKADFFSDTAKLYNNFQYLNQVKLYRGLIADDYAKAEKVLEFKSSYYQDAASAANRAGAFEPQGSFARLAEIAYSPEQFLAANPSFVRRSQMAVALTTGPHALTKDTIIPSGLRLVIDPGATVYLAPGVSLLSYGPVEAKGAPDKKIKFLRADPAKAWGSLAVIDADRRTSYLDNVEIDGGSGGVINGLIITGQLALHDADAEITNSSFKNSGSDDSLNLKYGRGLVANNVFSKSLSDAIDCDFVSPLTVIKNNRIDHTGPDGDAIDISWSDFLIEGNQIQDCTDKGVSIGESSRPTVKNNVIARCDIGIAVKDLSVAEISGNKISQVRVGIDAYRKKPVFGGGTANLSDNTFTEAKTVYQRDDLSIINVLK